MQPNLPSGLDYASIKDRFATGALSLAEVAQELSDGWAARYREATKDATELVEIDQGELT